MKRNIFQTVLSQFIFIGIIMLLSLLTTNESISQFVRNGSFEIHKDSIYPKDLSGSTDYSSNQLMKCIGFRLDPQRLTFGWDPLLPTMRRGEKLFVSLSAVEMYFFLFQIIINICMYPFATKI